MVNEDGTAKLDEEFTETIIAFKQWCNQQEDTLKNYFYKRLYVMKKNYIDVPSFTHIDDIESKTTPYQPHNTSHSI